MLQKAIFRKERMQAGSAGLRARLADLDARIGYLQIVRDRQGDSLAGRLIASVEREREQVLVELGYVGRPGRKVSA